MFSLSTLATSLAPLPPMPMPAMFRRSFAPSTLRRATKGKESAPATTAVRLTNWRRVMGGWFMEVDAICDLHLFVLPVDWSRIGLPRWRGRKGRRLRFDGVAGSNYDSTAQKEIASDDASAIVGLHESGRGTKA